MNYQLLQAVMIPLEKIENNTGQVDGLPANPRKCTEKDLQTLKKSLKETPEMLGARELLVVPHCGKYVVVGGNMRLRALRAIGETQAPCKILPEGADLKAILIKDNVSNGEWDNLMLEDWDAQKLADWGIKLPTKKETEKLSVEDFNTIYYQPKPEEITDISNCIDRTLFDKKMDVINNAPLSDEQKEHLKMFAYRFLRIDFERVANYYAYKASDAEKEVIERLRLVLVDNGQGGGLDGFIEDDLLKIADVFQNE